LYGEYERREANQFRDRKRPGLPLWKQEMKSIR
jgi:hypothetical protein